MKWAKRKPVVAGLTAALVFLAASSVLLLSRQLQHTRSALARSEKNLYLNRVALAERSLMAANLDAAEAQLTACPAPLRHFEWHYVHQLCRGELQTLIKRGPTYGTAFTRDGRRIAGGAAANSRDLRVWDTERGPLIHTLKGHKAEIALVVLNGDGTLLVSASKDSTVRLWDLTSGQEIGTVRAQRDAAVRRIGLRGDSQWLATAEGDNSVRVWNTATGKEAASFYGHTNPVTSLIVSSDETRVASLNNSKARQQRGRTVGPAELRVWQAATGTEFYRIGDLASSRMGRNELLGTRLRCIASCRIRATSAARVTVVLIRA